MPQFLVPTHCPGQSFTQLDPYYSYYAAYAYPPPHYPVMQPPVHTVNQPASNHASQHTAINQNPPPNLQTTYATPRVQSTASLHPTLRMLAIVLNTPLRITQNHSPVAIGGTRNTPGSRQEVQRIPTIHLNTQQPFQPLRTLRRPMYHPNCWSLHLPGV